MQYCKFRAGLHLSVIYNIILRISMNAKRTAALITLVAIIAVLSPMLVPDSEALKDGDISVRLENGADSIDISLEGGESKSTHVYVTNKTKSNVALNGMPVSGLGGDLSAVVTVSINDKVGSHVLSPAGKDGSFAVLTVTIHANSYADTATWHGTLTLNAMDLDNDEGELLPISKPVNVSVESAFVDGDSYNKFFGVFPNTFDAPLNSPWFAAGVTMILWIIATIIVSEILIPLLTHFVGARKTAEEKKSLTKRLTKTITAIMFVIAFNECAQIVGAGAEVSHFIKAISNVIYVVLGAAITWQIYMFIVTAFLKGLDETADVDGMDMSLLPLFKMIGKLAISVTGVCAALAAFGVDLAGIMVSAGVVTLGITLGAQNTLNQFFSGIVLLATRPFHKGDFVRIGGETYIVRKVKLMYTEFENWDKDQTVTIPNNAVSSATLINLTKDHHRTRVMIYIDVAYGSDIPKVKECLERAGAKHPHVITDGSCTPPSPRLVEFAGSGIRFRLSCYVDDYDNSSHYAGQIRELVWQELVDNDIEVPYDRIQVDILSEPSKDGKDPTDSA